VVERSSGQVTDNLKPGTPDPLNPVARLWQMTWKRTALLTAVCLLPLLVLARWQIALGVLAGSLLLLGDILVLKAPLDLMVRRVSEARRVWLFALTLLRIVALGAILLVLIKFRIANVFGVFAGVTLPLVALVWSALLGGRRTQGLKDSGNQAKNPSNPRIPESSNPASADAS